MKNEQYTMYGQAVSITTPPEQPKVRLDIFLHEQFPLYSRSFFNRAIIDGLVSIDDQQIRKTGHTVNPQQKIAITFPKKRDVSTDMVERAQIPIQVIAEHEDFKIINKPAGLLVHPTTSTSNEITLMDWLLCNINDIGQVGCLTRPGIIHRLDKLTSGIMVVPCTNQAYTIFGDMFRDRTIHKSYIAVVHGHPPRQGTVDLALARHHIERNRMTTVTAQEYAKGKGRHAITHYTVEQYFNDTSLIRVQLETGRTHQIRVHMAAIGHPIVGDVLYGTPSPALARQALHAHELAFTFQGKNYHFQAPIPEDMATLISNLADSCNADKH